MLSRTADCLYWMARYTERAENTARMLNVAYQTSLLPHSPETIQEGWKKILTISKLEYVYFSRNEKISTKNILFFMIFDTNNPSSIVSCLKAARENARAIRGSITSEVWETQNGTWLEFQKHLKYPNIDNPSDFLDWIKYQCHLSRGVISGTMLQNVTHTFMRIGTLLERADNTARILETQYQIPASKYTKKISAQNMDQDFLDFYYWAALLRSVSAFEIYRQIYSDHITPKQAAELLLFNPELPRSLVCCVTELIDLFRLVKNQDAKQMMRLIGKLKSDLDFSNIDEVFEIGLDEFIKVFLEKINHIADEFSNTYLIPLAIA